MRSKKPAQQQDAPTAELRELDGQAVLHLHGAWTVYTLEQGKSALAEAKKRQQSRQHQAINLDGVNGIDTSGAMLINSISASSTRKAEIKIASSNPDFQAILDLSHRAARPKRPRDRSPNVFVRIFHSAGEKICTEMQLVVDIISFFGQLVIRLGQSIRRPSEINPAALVTQLEQTGVLAVPIVALLNFLIGLVIAYMAAAQLVLFGAQIFVVNLLEVASLREMSVLVTSILVAGRSGSSFTAQIGSMVSNEEVSAMRSMGIDPMLRLVVPRVLALLISLPFLVIIADIMALLGGMFAVWFSMDISPTVFMNTLQESIKIKHLMVGLMKAPFFAVVIGCVGCFLGFRATGSADSIGVLTTRSVVESIFLVIILDAVFALILSTLGI